MRANSVLVALGVLVSLAGCGGDLKKYSPEEQKLRQGLKFLKRVADPPVTAITKTDRKMLIQRIEEYGLIDGIIIEANGKSGSSNTLIPPLYNRDPKESWCLVLNPGIDDRHVLVQGFGKDTVKPLFWDQIKTIDLVGARPEPDKDENSPEEVLKEATEKPFDGRKHPVKDVPKEKSWDEIRAEQKQQEAEAAEREGRDLHPPAPEKPLIPVEERSDSSSETETGTE